MLPVAERELRSAARQPRTYRTRLGIAALGVLIFGFIVWSGRTGNGLTGPQMFALFSWIAFVYTLLAGVALTADSLSSEKRENTLGLLFLTRLKGHDVVFGKLFSSLLNCFFGLLAIFPVLAIPLLMGGVQLAEFGRIVLSLINSLLLSASLGLFISSLCRQPLRATGIALLTVFWLAIGMMGIGELMRHHYKLPGWATLIQSFSPLHCHNQAFAGAFWAPSNTYWRGLGTIFVTSLILLAGTCWVVPRCWKEKPGGRRAFSWRERVRRLKFGSADARMTLRSRLLAMNPFCWVASRERVGSFEFLLLMVALFSLTTWGAWRVGHLMIGPPRPLGGFVFIWFWAMILVHGLLLFRIAFAASQRFAEDRHSGALELLLATPIEARKIIRGQWIALVRQMAGPGIIAFLTLGFVMWGALELLVIEISNETGIRTPLQALGSIWAHPSVGPEVLQVLGFMGRLILFASILVVAHWITLGWVGMWMGLRAKYQRSAPWLTLALVFVPPWPLFILTAATLGDVLTFWSEFELMHLFLNLGFALGLFHTTILSFWARRNLRRFFRLAVTDRSLFIAMKRSWRERGRIALRCGLATCALLALSVLWHQIENWRAARTWNSFVRELESRGQQLDLDSILPPPVPDDQNFALAPIWHPIFGQKSGRSGPRNAVQSLNALQSITITGQMNARRNTGDPRLGNWRNSKATELAEWKRYFEKSAFFPKSLEPLPPADTVLTALNRFTNELAGFHAAAQRPMARFPVDYKHAQHRYSYRVHLTILRSVAEVLQLRAVALLATGKTADALADIELIFRFAEALDREPFVESQSVRYRLANLGIQAIWDGMIADRWSNSELERLQMLLAKVDFLTAYGNGIRSEILLQIENWNRFQATMAGDIPNLARQERKQRLLRLFYPIGWARYHQIDLYRLYEEKLRPVIDIPERRFDASKAQEAQRAVQQFRSFIENRGLNRTFRDFPFESANAQTSVDLALVACALERYRIAHREYPESLDLLEPAFLHAVPRDLITGEPLQYRRTDDGRFILYSVGRNQRDDDGQAANENDWVWEYPARSR